MTSQLHPCQAEDDKKAEKITQKKQKKEDQEPATVAKRPASKKVKDVDPKGPPKGGAKAKAEKPVAEKPVAKAKGKAKAKAMASPKRRTRKSKLAQEPLETGQSEMSDKEKRRVKAKEGWERLLKDQVADLPMPSNINDRLSFTIKDPKSIGSSVGVILNTESFYINKATAPSAWPSDIKHLKVGSCFCWWFDWFNVPAITYVWVLWPQSFHMLMVPQIPLYMFLPTDRSEVWHHFAMGNIDGRSLGSCEGDCWLGQVPWLTPFIFSML